MFSPCASNWRGIGVCLPPMLSIARCSLNEPLRGTSLFYFIYLFTKASNINIDSQGIATTRKYPVCTPCPLAHTRHILVPRASMISGPHPLQHLEWQPSTVPARVHVLAQTKRFLLLRPALHLELISDGRSITGICIPLSSTGKGECSCLHRSIFGYAGIPACYTTV